ncbi:SDR family oxidoreductase [Sporichthya brevicatena]|uniref:SDR family oxidoreductase n=1 Tax=Sporichthya brevicatena TaxID=171442 RepID=A0ABN1GS57_9ACTN
MKLAGTHALVTGGSHGIGIEIAREFVARGARVTVLGRDKERLAAVAAEYGATPLVADLADPERLATVLSEAEAALGPVDVLVNNAALAAVATADSMSAAETRLLMDVNATAPMELCRQALPGMLARRRGHLVNVSTLAAVSAVPELSVYGASKAALHQYTAVLQRDLKGTPLTATLATLGEVAGTHMMEQARQSPKIAAVSKRLARLLPVLTPPEVARQLTDAVERDARYVTIPRRLSPVVTIRNLPSTLNDLAFLGLRT